MSGDNSDLLLPSVINTLPREYLAMLYRNETNRSMILNSREDEVRRTPKWVVVPYNLTVDTCVGLVNSRTSNPFLIRGYLEGRKQTDVEGRGKTHIENEML